MSLEEAERLKAMIAARPQARSIEERRAGFEAMAARFGRAEGVLAEPYEAGGLSGLVFRPETSTDDLRVYHLHGGAFTVGSSTSYSEFCGRLAKDLRATVYCPDYPLAPEHLFPKALEDCINGFEALLSGDSGPWVLSGDSCGGNLATALCQNLMARSRPLPKAVYLISPYLDLTHSGRSVTERDARDVFVRAEGMAATARCYLGDADPSDPRASPLFGAFQSFPSTLIQVGSEEVLFSDAERLKERLDEVGVEAILEEWEGMIHVFPFFGPVLNEARRATATAATTLKSWIR